jgi:DNA-directed RNA polymerase specialized sigma54-like protein
MKLPAKVSRSTMAAQKRASVKVLVQPVKLSMLVMATALVSSLSENLEQKLNTSAIQHHVSQLIETEQVDPPVADDGLGQLLPVRRRRLSGHHPWTP